MTDGPTVSPWAFVGWLYLWFALAVLVSYGIRTLGERVLTPRRPAWRAVTAEAIGALSGLATIGRLSSDLDAVIERCACANGVFYPAMVGSITFGLIVYAVARALLLSGLAPSHNRTGVTP